MPRASQPFLLSLTLSILCSAAVCCADDVPKGEVTKYAFDHSKIFPGTVRDYWVYVPQQYDPSKSLNRVLIYPPDCWFRSRSANCSNSCSFRSETAQ